MIGENWILICGKKVGDMDYFSMMAWLGSFNWVMRVMIVACYIVLALGISVGIGSMIRDMSK